MVCVFVCVCVIWPCSLLTHKSNPNTLCVCKCVCKCLCECLSVWPVLSNALSAVGSYVGETTTTRTSVCTGGQGRAGQGRAGQARPGQARAGQGRAGVVGPGRRDRRQV